MKLIFCIKLLRGEVMKHLLNGISIIIFLLIFSSGCKDNPVKPDNNYEKAIIGKVTDSNGNAVPDVSIHYIFFTGNDYLIYKNASIKYGFETNQNITLSIFDMFSKEIARPIDNQSQRAGYYTYFFDASDLTNGIYSYKVMGNKELAAGSFIIIDDNITNLIKTKPLTKTDAFGSFKLDYSVLGLGRVFKRDLQSGLLDLVVADSIKLVFYKNDYPVKTSWLKIDTTKTTSQTFVISR
jgi:hypothetical protein